MTDFIVNFSIANQITPTTTRVPAGTVLSDAARLAGIDIGQPCGGQGRCGRCIVQVTGGSVRRRSALRLSAQDLAEGYALACQSVVESDLVVTVPPQEKVERRLTTDRTLPAVTVPVAYDPTRSPSIHRIVLRLQPPSLDNQVDDWSHLETAFRQATGFAGLTISLPGLRQLGETLRQGEWTVSLVYDTGWDVHGAENLGEPDAKTSQIPRLIAVLPGAAAESEPLWGAAIDIGTTTVTAWIVDLTTGQVKGQASEYNGQIARGEDVISRIIYASRDGTCRAEMQHRVVETINALISQACVQAGAEPGQVVKATVAGNSTMTHLFLGIPAASIRLAPFIPAANRIPSLKAAEIGLGICPEATVDCLPGVASYVGSDITAGVLSSGLDALPDTAIFIDIGTNGETVLGCSDWLVTCACSAGPAFEGAGVQHGMRATQGAIEEVWINSQTFEPTYRTIGDTAPLGLCGSGLISLLAELFLSGVLDKAGHFNLSLPTNRLRQGEHGPEYMVANADETQNGQEIVLMAVDIDNLLRAKAAIYAGFAVLADRVGFPLETVDQVLIGGSFGRYINIEKAIQIGLLPDLPWDRFKFLGNTSVRGAYQALLGREARLHLDDIASKMTYIELSADNTFYEAFMSAMFLPHTDLAKFPSVKVKKEE